MKKVFCTIMICIAVILAIQNTQSASACQCVTKSLEEKFNDSDFIFSARILNITKNTETEDYVLFGIDRAWKGLEQDTYFSFNPSTDAACGFSFKVSEDYLVYSYKKGDNPYTGVCTGTKPLSEADEDLKSLGNPIYDKAKELARLQKIEDAYNLLEKIKRENNPDIPISELSRDRNGIIIWINDDSNPTLDEYRTKLKLIVGDVPTNIIFGDYQFISNKTLGSERYGSEPLVGLIQPLNSLYFYLIIFGSALFVGFVLYLVFKPKKKLD